MVDAVKNQPEKTVPSLIKIANLSKKLHALTSKTFSLNYDEETNKLKKGIETFSAFLDRQEPAIPNTPEIKLNLKNLAENSYKELFSEKLDPAVWEKAWTDRSEQIKQRLPINLHDFFEKTISQSLEQEKINIINVLEKENQKANDEKKKENHKAFWEHLPQLKKNKFKCLTSLDEVFDLSTVETKNPEFKPLKDGVHIFKDALGNDTYPPVRVHVSEGKYSFTAHDVCKYGMDKCIERILDAMANDGVTQVFFDNTNPDKLTLKDLQAVVDQAALHGQSVIFTPDTIAKAHGKHQEFMVKHNDYIKQLSHAHQAAPAPHP